MHLWRKLEPLFQQTCTANRSGRFLNARQTEQADSAAMGAKLHTQRMGEHEDQSTNLLSPL
jgi:hypothetical protein